MKLLNILVEVIKNVAATIPFLKHNKEKYYSRERKSFADETKRFFNMYKNLCERYKDDLIVLNKTILELGPGNSLAMALLFLAAGAKKIILVDRFKHFFWDKYDIDFLKYILLEISKTNLPCKKRVLESISIKDDKSILMNSDQIEYFLATSFSIPVDSETIDIVFSNAVLEHTHDPGKTLMEIDRVTKAGGVSIHEIDLRDHFFKNTSLRLLQYTDWLWNLMTWYRPGYSNRLRFSDWVLLFEKSGFSVKKLRLQNKILMEF